MTSVLLAIKEKQQANRRAATTLNPDDIVVYKKMKKKKKTSIYEVKLRWLHLLLEAEPVYQ